MDREKHEIEFIKLIARLLGVQYRDIINLVEESGGFLPGDFWVASNDAMKAPVGNKLFDYAFDC